LKGCSEILDGETRKTRKRERKKINQCQARKNYATLAIQEEYGSRLDKLKNTKKI
jgi:hypothetical protein